ncbi:MAG: putative xanthine dehydrogenase subunit A [Chloroflexi bacterium]|nr:putative xanthine dehydrogenase subunit A [Chloroflexota bacterium]
MKENIFEIIANAAEPLALVTIVNAKGSTPRHTGTRMLVKKDGSIVGTIGGGEAEVMAIERSQQVIKERVSTQLELGMKNRDLLASGMVCGGQVNLWIEYVSDPVPYALIAERIKRGKASLLLIDLKEEQGVVNVVDTEGDLLFGNDRAYDRETARTAAQTGEAVLSKADGLFHDPVTPPDKLLILGGGHVGLALARLAGELDFEITVGDFREFVANPERYPENVSTLHAPFEDIIKEYIFTPLTYVIVAGPSHKSDFECVRDVLPQPHKYVGCLGSRRKIRMLLDYLEKEGLEEEEFEILYAPIGIDIGSETPAEIACSILAELIAVRRNAANLSRISLKLERGTRI